jgi:hypothetical protein
MQALETAKKFLLLLCIWPNTRLIARYGYAQDTKHPTVSEGEGLLDTSASIQAFSSVEYSTFVFDSLQVMMAVRWMANAGPPLLTVSLHLFFFQSKVKLQSLWFAHLQPQHPLVQLQPVSPAATTAPLHAFIPPRSADDARVACCCAKPQMTLVPGCRQRLLAVRRSAAS